MTANTDRVDDRADFLKVPEVQQRLRLSRSAVYDLMDKGEISYAKFGRARRVRADSLEAYIRRSTIPARTS